MFPVLYSRSFLVTYLFYSSVCMEPDFPGGSDGKEFTCNVGELGQIPGLGRSPGEGNSYPLQYFDLENSMDRGASQATVHGVTNLNILIYNSHSTFPFGKPSICFLCLRVYFCLINMTRLYTPMFRSNIPAFLNSVGLEKKHQIKITKLSYCILKQIKPFAFTT